jgi:predicted transcriptional regulator
VARAKTRTRSDLELFGELLKTAITRPEETPDRLTVLSLPDEEQDQLLTLRRLELIRALRDHRGAELTVSELAEAVGRRVDVVSRDLHVLERYGIVELERVGRTKQVRLATDMILIHLRAIPDGPRVSP